MADQDYTIPVGVNTSLLLILVEKCSHLPDGYTTKDACDQVVMPMTKDMRCAFIDFYRDKKDHRGKAYVAPATAFVSHAWRFPLSTSLSVMRAHAKLHPNSYFWFDVCVNNQHSAPSRSHDWWSTTFKRCISTIGRVILVLAPWTNPIPLTRAWCLWEILCALDSPGVEFLIRLPPADKKSFEEGITDNFRLAMDALVATQAEEAEAYDENDQKMIFTAIEETIGFNALNAKVKEQMRNWFIETGGKMADEMEWEGKALTKEFGHLCFQLGTMLKDFAAYKEAERKFEQTLTAKKHCFGEEDFSLAMTYNNQAINFKKQGKNQLAMEAYQHSLDLKLANPSCGPNHQKTATTYNNMGNIYKNDGDHDKAQEVYDKALKIRLEKLGSEHKEVASTYNNMGDNYRLQGENQKAQDCLEEALRIKLKCPELGPNHPGTVTTFANLGKLYLTLGRLEDSLEMTNHCLKVRFVTLGDHNHTRSTCKNAVRDALKLAKGPFTDKRKAKAAIHTTAELVASYKGAKDSDAKKLAKAAASL